MNAPIVVAQANTTGTAAGSRALRTIKVQKPQGDQAVTVQLGYDQNYKLDLSLIANEKITLVHIGEKLIILFDNKSTVTVEPFFDSMNAPLSNVTVEANGRDFTGSEFASAFPITTDQSVLTAAGVAGFAGSPASGADFRGSSVDPLNEPNPLPLLGQEELPNFVITQQLGIAPAVTTTIAAVIANLPPDAAPGQAQANEKGLPGQEGEGFGLQVGSGEIADGDAFNNSDPSESTTGALSFSDPDGTAQVTLVNGTPVIADGTVIFGNFGFLTINLDGTFTYTLTQNDLNHTSQGTGSDGEEDVFTYTVEDSSGATQSSTLTIDIVDDVPTARLDTDTIVSGGTSADGNVLNGIGTNEGFNGAGADTVGADGASVTGVVAGTGATPVTDGSGLGGIAGNFGTLTLNANGSYVYARTPGTPGNVSDVFTYTLTDGDGDTSTATLTINIENNGPAVSVPTLQDPGTQVNEDGLPARAAAPEGTASATDSEVTSGTINFTSLDGVSSVEIAGVTVTPGSLPQTVVSDATGTLVITAFSFNPGTGAGLIDYTYTLADNTLTNPSDVSFSVVVTDADGDAANGTLTIDIVDDAPSAVDDTDALSNATNTATGNVITAADTTNSGADTLGADNALVSAIQGNNPGASSLTNVGAGGVTINGQYGTLTIAQDGTYTYTRTVLGALSATDAFSYTLSDGDGDVSTATLTISINDGGVTITNLTPQAQGGDVSVNEDDLLATRGVGESAGSDVTKESTTQTGTFNISAPDGLGSLTVGGHAVITGGVFTATSFTTGLGNTLAITGFNAGTGQITYSYTLLDNETHAAGGGANSLFEDFAVVLTDTDGSTANDTLSVNIVDDLPAANQVTKNLLSAGHDTNIMLILDTSGSMSDPSGLPGLSRLAVMKAAVTDLLDKYGDIGDVRVQIVQFSSNGSQVGSNWMTVAQAVAAVNALTAGGTTDFDAAVAVAQSIYGASGKLATADVQNVSYFMSDGVPNESNGTGTNGIVGSEITNWQNFLQTNDINSFALGMGAGATQSTLNPLAYNGVTSTDTNAVIVTDLSQLSTVLLGTITTTGGNILTDGVLPGSFGADGGYVKSITVDGTTYTFDPAGGGSITVSGTNHGSFDTTTNTETVTLASGGVLTMVMDNGTFNYTAPANVGSAFTDSVQFLLTDNDGDTASNTLDIVVTIPNQAPSITSNGGGATASVSVNENATAVTTVTSSDTDGPSATFSIVGGADAAKFSINASTGALTFITPPNFEAPTDAGANNVYNVTVQVSDGALTDTQEIAVTVTNVNEFAPVITSNLGGATAAVNVAENSTFVTTVVATDADLTTPTYSISGGADAAKFSINASTGVLSFLSAPNFEAPTDVGANNVYNVTVRASDGTNVDDQAIAVTVTNANDAPTAVNDILISNFGGSSYSVPEWAFLFNDSDPEGNAIDVNDTPSESGLTSINHTPGVGTNGTIDINDNGNGGSNTFTYNVTDGSLVSSDATVSVTNQNGGNLTGTASNEILVGDSNGNTFSGGDGNDIILAGGGADSLNGGNGNDILVGGSGKDTMTGGSGNDTFLFTATGDSATTSGNADIITDFVHGQDKIDLRPIDANTGSGGDQAFNWGGTSATANGVWYTESGGNTIISMDTNGSTGSAEMVIVLTGIGKNLNAADFHL